MKTKRILIAVASLALPMFGAVSIPPPPEASVQDITNGTIRSKYISPFGLAQSGAGPAATTLTAAAAAASEGLIAISTGVGRATEFTDTIPLLQATTFTFSTVSGSGKIDVPHGGTGVGTLTGIARGNGTSVMTASELSGDVTTSGSNVVTVQKINSVSLAGLATGILKNTTTTGAPSIAVAGTDYIVPGASTGQTDVWVFMCSDATTALTTGTAKGWGSAPRAATVTAVRAFLLTAQASGSIFTVDINEGVTTILSTKLTIDNTELNSTTAATAAVISDTAIAANAAMTVDIDQIGASGAAGLVVLVFVTY